MKCSLIGSPIFKSGGEEASEVLEIGRGDDFSSGVHSPAGKAEVECGDAGGGGHDGADGAAGGDVGAVSGSLEWDVVRFGNFGKGCGGGGIACVFAARIEFEHDAVAEKRGILWVVFFGVVGVPAVAHV